jgi:hypothetical protein
MGSGREDQFAKCLPEGIDVRDVVSGQQSESGGEVKAITVGETLVNLKARCKRGKVVDGKLREIRFYRLKGCWGNPPANYLEVLEKQEQELKQLRKKYTVVAVSCNSGRNPRLTH